MADKTINKIEAFAAYYLLPYLTSAVPPFHRELYKLAFEGHKRLCIIAPRSFAKSTVFSIIYPLFQLCEGRATKIWLLSNTASLAEQWLRKIKAELDYNEYLRADFGDMKTDKWSESHIICHNKTQNRTIELRANGWGTQIRGFRPDILIGDDLENEDTVASEAQREKMGHWLRSAAINTLEKDSQAIIVGTLIHPEAVLKKDVADNPEWTTRFYQAIQKDGTSLWPEKWPIDALMERKREIGDRAFAAEFQNTPVISEAPVFYKEWIKEYDPTSSAFADIRRKGLYTVLALDPAISEKENADYSAICTLSADYDTGNIYVRRGGVWRDRCPIQNTVDSLIRLYKQFQCKTAIIEGVAFQRVVGDWIKRWERDSAEHICTRIVIPDKDKERRAHAVTGLLQEGKVFFDTSDPMTSALVTEMCLFPTGSHDDITDAFVFALSELQQWLNRRKNMKKGAYIVLPKGVKRNSATGIMA